MPPCILFKKIGDLNVTLLKNDLNINLPCKQVAHGYSMGNLL